MLPFFFVCLLSPLLAQQDDLTKSKRFLKNQLPEYEAWMQEIRLDKVVVIEALDIQPGQVRLQLKNHEDLRNPEMMSRAWVYLRKQLEDSTGVRLEWILLQKFSHVMEIAPDQAEIMITGYIPSQFSLSIGYRDGRFTITEKMGEVRGDALVKVNVKDIKALGSRERAVSGNPLERTKDRLLDQLTLFYRSAESKFGNEPRVEILMNRENEFTLLISNLTSQIIDTYFELIRLNIQLQQVNESIEISYTVFGKYSSGIFSAPRVTSSDYQDMYPEYSAELILYTDKLGQSIQQILIH